MIQQDPYLITYVDASLLIIFMKLYHLSGLPDDQYYFTLGLSMVGGLILGFVSRLEPQGFVKRKWVWSIIFAPLWAPIFINFGLGPVISRTDDTLPVIQNTAGFLVAALLPQIANVLLKPKDIANESD